VKRERERERCRHRRRAQLPLERPLDLDVVVHEIILRDERGRQWPLDEPLR
jgi:hypothetical protein